MQGIRLNPYREGRVILSLLVKKLAQGHITEGKNQNFYPDDPSSGSMPSITLPWEGPERRGRGDHTHSLVHEEGVRSQVRALVSGGLERMRGGFHPKIRGF